MGLQVSNIMLVNQSAENPFHDFQIKNVGAPGNIDQGIIAFPDPRPMILGRAVLSDVPGMQDTFRVEVEMGPDTQAYVCGITLDGDPISGYRYRPADQGRYIWSFADGTLLVGVVIGIGAGSPRFDQSAFDGVDTASAALVWLETGQNEQLVKVLYTAREAQKRIQGSDAMTTASTALFTRIGMIQELPDHVLDN